MFIIQWLDRDLTRAEFQQIYRVVRKHGDQPHPADESILAEREEIKRLIDECLEDGAIAVVQSGMDCDCVQYCWSHLMHNPTPMRFWHEREEERAWADGPISIGICKPSERPISYTRDLVLEGFENGNSYSLTTATV